MTTRKTTRTATTSKPAAKNAGPMQKIEIAVGPNTDAHDQMAVGAHTSPDPASDFDEGQEA